MECRFFLLLAKTLLFLFAYNKLRLNLKQWKYETTLKTGLFFIFFPLPLKKNFRCK